MTHLQRIPAPRFPDVILRSSPNWTIASLLAIPGGLHLGIAAWTALHGRWEAYMSFIIGTALLSAACATAMFRTEFAVRVSCRHIRRRTGIGRWNLERVTPFDGVSAVRLTLAGGNLRQARIEIICPMEEIDFPPTPVPRQEALLLAMMLDVPLIRIGDGAGQSPDDPDIAAQQRPSPSIDHPRS
jgi:hypothetical protein